MFDTMSWSHIDSYFLPVEALSSYAAALSHLKESDAEKEQAAALRANRPLTPKLPATFGKFWGSFRDFIHDFGIFSGSLCCLELGDNELALAEAEQAKALRPAWPKAHFRMANALKATGRSEQRECWRMEMWFGIRGNAFDSFWWCFLFQSLKFFGVLLNPCVNVVSFSFVLEAFTLRIARRIWKSMKTQNNKYQKQRLHETTRGSNHTNTLNTLMHFRYSIHVSNVHIGFYFFSVSLVVAADCFSFRPAVAWEMLAWQPVKPCDCHLRMLRSRRSKDRMSENSEVWKENYPDYWIF